MGRKVDYAEKPKKGPGRKSKKQSDPALGILSGSIKNKEVQALKKQTTPVKPKEAEVEKKMSSHQKKRAKKRAEKKIAKKAGIKLPKPKAKAAPKEASDGESDEDIYNSDSSVEEEEEEVVESEEEELPPFIPGSKPKGFTDDNKEWLTPKKLEGMDSDDESSEADDDDDVEGEEEEDSDDNMPADDFEAGSDASDDSDSDDSSESDAEKGEDDDGLLPIERKSKKLALKMKAEAEESQKEMQLNMTNREIFTLPSGQDIEKETAQAPDLQILQERIREVIK